MTLLGEKEAGEEGSGFGLLDRSNNRSSHKGVVPKGGGIGILAAFLLQERPIIKNSHATEGFLNEFTEYQVWIE